MKRNTHEPAPRDNYTAMQLGDITYLPHYRNKSIFVGPGYPHLNGSRFSQDELFRAGAKTVEMSLWIRNEHGVVTDSKP